MADARDDAGVFWIRPKIRGLFTFKAFHIPRSTRKMLMRTGWRITLNRDMPRVINLCASTRKETWINHDIEALYVHLYQAGHVHSVEVWDKDDALMGGLYGLSIGAAFFAESMVSL